jgi:hypothetical protein
MGWHEDVCGHICLCVYTIYIYTQIYEHICICRVEYVLWIGAWMGMSYIYRGHRASYGVLTGWHEGAVARTSNRNIDH